MLLACLTRWWRSNAPGTNYILRGRIETSGRFGYRINRFDRSRTASGGARNFKHRSFVFNSGVNDFIEIYCQHRNRTGRFDSISLENLDGTGTGGGGNFGLNPNADPWDNFDLSVWGLDSPNDSNSFIINGVVSELLPQIRHS